MIPILILIPAYNEAQTIDGTVTTLQCLLGEQDRLVIIDDGSTDDTAVIAGQAGAQVLSRCHDEAEGRKGAALCWGLGQVPVREGEIVIVLDADARVDDQFLELIRTRFVAGAQAVQSHITPVTEAHSPVASLAACSTLMEQAVDDGVRTWLGWPVRLRGTGMAFRRELLGRVLPQLKTTVEDVELTLLMAYDHIRVEFAPEAIVFDPLPSTLDAASRQRARWLTGQATVWRQYWPTLIRLLSRGPGEWSLVGSVLFKPRVVSIAIRGAALLFSLLWPQAWLLSLILGTSLLADAIYLGAAILIFGNARERLIFLTGMPLYAVMWARSTLLALRGVPGWLRARP